jgi:hypothetical protein
MSDKQAGTGAPKKGLAALSGDTDKRTLIVLGSALGGVVVLAGAFFLLYGKGGSGADSAGTVVTPAQHVTVPSVPGASASVSPTPSPGVVAGRDPFAVPAGLAGLVPTGGSAVPSASSAPPVDGAVPSSLSPSELAAIAAAGYNVTPIDASASAGASASPGASPGASGAPASSSPAPMKPSSWLQVLAAHKQSDGSWRIDVRAAGGVVKGVKPGATKVAGTALTYQGEDDELGVSTFVFTTTGSAGANVVANAEVAPYTGTLTPAIRPATLVYAKGTLTGGIF